MEGLRHGLDARYAARSRQHDQHVHCSHQVPDKHCAGFTILVADVANDTLPSVAFIDPGFDSGLDEHPGLDDGEPGGSVQLGSQYVSTLINALMQSSSWQDSVFILTLR